MEITTTQMQEMIEGAVAKALKAQVKSVKSHAKVEEVAEKLPLWDTYIITHFVPTKATRDNPMSDKAGYNVFLRGTKTGYKCLSVYVPMDKADYITAGAKVNGFLWINKEAKAQGSKVPTSVALQFGTYRKCVAIPKMATLQQQIVAEIKA